MKIIGITGNSGSGKTYIAQALAEKIKATIIDADKLVSQMHQEKGAYYKEIIKKFGEDILLPTKEINKKALAEIIFSNPKKLAQINKITKKHVVKKIKQQVKQANEGTIILDVPLLFESKLNKICTITIAILAEEKEKIKRICKRDNITEEAAKARLAIQTEEKIYIKKADITIQNNQEETNTIIQKIIKIINK